VLSFSFETLTSATASLTVAGSCRKDHLFPLSVVMPGSRVTGRYRCLKLDEEGGFSMPPLDWSQCPGIERIPGKVSGAWLFAGTRTPVAIVFENLEDGMTIDEVIDQFPVTREQVKAVLEFAARSLDIPTPRR
jgi:uncharacterized protein (DUF433 family)